MNTIEIILLGMLAIFIYTSMAAPGVVSNVFGIIASTTNIANIFLKDAGNGIKFASDGKDPLKYI